MKCLIYIFETSLTGVRSSDNCNLDVGIAGTATKFETFKNNLLCKGVIKILRLFDDEVFKYLRLYQYFKSKEFLLNKEILRYPCGLQIRADHSLRSI